MSVLVLVLCVEVPLSSWQSGETSKKARQRSSCECPSGRHLGDDLLQAYETGLMSDSSLKVDLQDNVLLTD